MLEFNSDGSLTLTPKQAFEKEKEEKSIVITREQLSEKPARAQIRIVFPEDLKNPEEVISFYNKIDDSQFSEVFHKIEKINNKTFVVKVEKGSMRMYSLLNFMMMCFKGKFERKLDFRDKQEVILKGRWANFG
ncbi:hypothetical protein ACFLZZ_00495 [Nanoarchaeota archaeon]